VDPAPGPLSPDPAPVTPFRRLRLGFLIAAAVLAASGAIVGTLAASFPTGHLLWALGSAGLFELTVVAWLVAGALGLAARRFDWALLVPPMVVAAALVLAWLDLPLQTRFAAARPGFEQVVAARGEAGPGAPCPERIGTYRIVLCQTTDSITRFYRRWLSRLGRFRVRPRRGAGTDRRRRLGQLRGIDRSLVHLHRVVVKSRREWPPCASSWPRTRSGL
jgi:hypothetical protein